MSTHTSAIEEGKSAPDFRLLDQDNTEVSLQSFRGRHLILYFYPKDDTPGCTKEACGFRRLYDRFARANTAIVGVSPDKSESHARFRNKYDLPFSLLSDPDKQLMITCGAWGEKNMYGKKVVGVIRSTLWIDPEGRVRKHWKKVSRAADHPQKVLELVEQEAS